MNQHHMYGDPKCTCPRCNGANPAYASRAAAVFLATFPGFETNYSMGGQCTAWRMALPGKGEVLVTCAELEPMQPAMDDACAAFSVDYDGVGVEPRVMSFEDGVRWLRGVMDAADAYSSFAP